MSSLYLRGNSVWVDYADRFSRRRRQATGFTLDRIEWRSGRILWPKHVVEWQKEFDRRLVYRKWDFNPEQTTGHPLGAVLASFLENEGGSRKPATRYLYESSWKLLLKHLGDVPIEQIGQDDIGVFRRSLLAQSKSDHTASKRLRSIATIFSWAEDRQILQRSPNTRLHAIQVKAKAVQTFTQKEIEKLLKASPPPARDLYRFLLMTGFRLGEACALEWKNIDLKKRVIRVYNIKEDRWEYFSDRSGAPPATSVPVPGARPIRLQVQRHQRGERPVFLERLEDDLPLEGGGECGADPLRCWTSYVEK